MSKDCKECVFYMQKEDQATFGTCGYPVPGWLTIRVPGGNFVSGYEGNNCAAHKTRAQLVETEIVTPNV